MTGHGEVEHDDVSAELVKGRGKEKTVSHQNEPFGFKLAQRV